MADMIISGANNLNNQKNIIDDLNVFPVPDGDTGTNMSLTMKAAVSEVDANRDKGTGAVAKALASSTLRGARGNSGVILSQLMRGIQKHAKDTEMLTAKDIGAAFTKASESAYRAVMKPTEGTILTVSRETAEAAVKVCDETDDIIVIFEKIVDAANKSLSRTPDLLPQLKQAGVVDAGGKGLVSVLEGCLEYLKTGKVVETSVEEVKKEASSIGADIDPESIKFIYCTEFLISKKDMNVDSFKFKTTIEHYGDSMVVIDDEDIIKVHIHTNEPNIVLGEALKLGALMNIKIDNMKFQHQSKLDISSDDAKTGEAKPKETPKPTEPPKKFGVIAVAVGDGIVNILTELGVDKIISGGQTMNPSTDDILTAIEELNAENIIVFPNNKNIILAAEQAKNLTEKNVYVIPTKHVTQSLSCMIAFDDSLSAGEMADNMNEIIGNVKSAQLTYSVRDTVVDGREISKGDILGIIEGKITHTGADTTGVLMDVLGEMTNGDGGIITVFYGEDISDTDIAPVEQMITEKFPSYDIAVYPGGQPVYSYILSVE